MITKKWQGIIIAGFTVFFLFIPAMAQQIEGRYLLPIYPTLSIFICIGLTRIFQLILFVYTLVKQQPKSQAVIEEE